MDISNLVKIQEDQFVQETDPHLKNEYMLHFYNNDSEEANLSIFKSQKSELSPQQIVEQIQTYLDIRTTNMSEILQFARCSTIFCVTDWEAFQKAVIKRKKMLKRIHAKRKNKGKVEKVINKEVKTIELIKTFEGSEDDQLEIKKKRNRMSAQISRDRKKQHIKQLQKNCKQYQKQAQDFRVENEKLRKQLENNSKSSSSVTKNKFVSLLILLGIFFLISLVRDVFKSNHEPNTFLSENSNKQSILTVGEQTEMIGKGKEFIQDIEGFEEKSPFEEPTIKNAVLLKLNQIEQESKPVSLPPKVFSKLATLKKEFF